MLEKFKIIFWDFDGVLMDSNSIRDLGFERVLSNYPRQFVQELMDFHRANGGLSRYVKFRYFFENILKQDVSETEIQVLAKEFSIIMKSLLLNPQLLIEDSMNFVKSQCDKGVKMHIVSGSDQEELRFLCRELEIDKYFISIHGSPTPKKVLVKELIDLNEYNKLDIAFIGDSVNDLEAAKLNGINFFGYNNMSLSNLPKYILSLNRSNIF